MKLFAKNVGMVDRVLRIIVGFALLGYGAKFFEMPWNAVAIVVGFIIAATGALGTCAVYSLLGINTAGQKKGAAAPRKARKAR